MERRSVFFVLIIALYLLFNIFYCKKEPKYDGLTQKQWIAELKSNDKEKVIKAAETLSKIKPVNKDVVPALLELKSNKDKDIEKAMAFSLGYLKDSSALDFLIARLYWSDNWQIYAKALEFFGKGAHPKLIEALETLHKESIYQDIICSRILYTLSRIKQIPPKTVIFCIRLLNQDKSIKIKAERSFPWLIPAYSILALSSCDDKDSMEILKKNLELNDITGPLGPFLTVRALSERKDLTDAVRELGKIFKQKKEELIYVPGILPMLEAIRPQDLRNENYGQMIQLLLDWLGQYLGPEHRKKIEQAALKSAKSSFNYIDQLENRSAYRKQKKSMEEYISTFKILRKRAVILALNEINTDIKIVRDLLNSALKDKNTTIRQAAQKVLSNIKKKRDGALLYDFMVITDLQKPGNGVWKFENSGDSIVN